jgi:hypothetical protein
MKKIVCSFLLSVGLVFGLQSGEKNEKNFLPPFYEWKEQCDKNIPHFGDLPHIEQESFFWKEKGPAIDESVVRYDVYRPYPDNKKKYSKFVDTAMETFLAKTKTEVKGAGIDGTEIKLSKTVPLHDREADIADAFVAGMRVDPKTDIIFLGDRHGDVRSLLSLIEEFQNQGIMDGWKIVDEKTKIAFLGDLVDSGIAGLATLITVLTLANENPNKVFTVRGNHEHFFTHHSTIVQEIDKQFAGVKTEEEKKMLLEKINTIYAHMPHALFVGFDRDNPESEILKTDYLLGCHGYLDPFYNPGDLLAALADTEIDVMRYENVQPNRLKNRHQWDHVCNEADKNNDRPSKNDNSRESIVDMWNKLSRSMGFWLGRLKDSQWPETSYSGYEISWSKRHAEALMKNYKYVRTKAACMMSGLWGTRKKPYQAKVKHVIRGHQHVDRSSYQRYPDTMNALWKGDGCARQWHSNYHNMTDPYGVFTCLVAPDTMYSVKGDLKKGNKYPGFNWDSYFKVSYNKDRGRFFGKPGKKKMFF